jgi:hypothetical protein
MLREFQREDAQQREDNQKYMQREDIQKYYGGGGGGYTTQIYQPPYDRPQMGQP